MQMVSSWIWTQVSVMVFYENNRYTMSTTAVVMTYEMCFLLVLVHLELNSE